MPATGTMLVRAKLHQVSPCTEREKMIVSTQGRQTLPQCILRGAWCPQAVVQPPAPRQQDDSWVVTLANSKAREPKTIALPTKDCPAPEASLIQTSQTVLAEKLKKDLKMLARRQQSGFDKTTRRDCEECNF